MAYVAMMALTKAKVLDAALVIVDEGGLEFFSARRLAKSLGVSVMASYRHFPDQESLLAALFDHVIIPEELLVEAPEAEEVLVGSMARIYALFEKHPALVPLAGTPASVGENCLCFLESLLARLQQDVSPAIAARAIHRTLTYTFGCAIVAASSKKTNAIASVAKRFQNVDPAQFPHALASGSELLRFTTRDAYMEGLSAIARDVLSYDD